MGEEEVDYWVAVIKYRYQHIPNIYVDITIPK